MMNREFLRCFSVSQTAVIFLALVSGVGITGCRKSVNTDLPIKIEATSPLRASVGADVKWGFKATRGGREIKIKSIQAYPLPFGVKLNAGADQQVLAGKVLGRQFRTGQIVVTAFDKDGCESDYRNAARATTKTSLAAGIKEFVIPVVNCDGSGAAGAEFYGANFGNASFEWRMDDGPDDLGKIDLKNYFAGLSRERGSLSAPPQKAGGAKAGSGKPVGMTEGRFVAVDVPANIAPGSFDLNVGSCANLSRSRCGDKASQCLWALNTCLSRAETGRSAEGGTTK